MFNDDRDDESIFESLRDNPPDWMQGDRAAGWRDGLDTAQEHIIAALSESFHSCPYVEPVAGLTPLAVWELAIVNVASRMRLQFFDDDLEDEDADD